MKKALSVLLSVLVLFSMVGIMATAEGESERVTVYFYVDGVEYYKIEALSGVNFVDRLQNGEQKLEEPAKAPTETTEYTFKYWEKCNINENGELIPTGEITYTGNVPPAYEDTYYVAVFAEEEIKENQSLWAFIRTIFERINMIFEYFAEVFRGVIDFD